MTVINDLTNRTDMLPLSYGRHIVTGKGTKHVTGTAQVMFQRALGWASFYDRAAAKYRGRGWQECEKLYYRGFEIPTDHYSFHSGGPADAPDTYFPDDIAHPRASYIGGQLPDGMSVDNEPDEITGVFKTLKTANYNEDGDQVDEDGDVVVLADPDDALFYNAKPALHVIDIWRRTRRAMLSVNWPAWCDWRDFCAELINWDDGALTPHQVSLAAASGGSLAAATYWVRIATLKGGDLSSASKDRANDGFTTASVLVGPSGKLIASWASQEDRGADGYRVYLGTAEGGEDRYFVVGSGATNTLEITTLAGATMGAPPEIATGTLLRQIPRFESHIFLVPPFDFITALDKIAQITCMDWRYSGGLLEFLTPEVREPVFTVNMAQLADFKTYKTDRRQKFNQIIVNYRNLDDEFLTQADPPVEINRYDLQDKQGVNTFQIDMGCSYRSQAERVGEYWAKRLIDSDQMIDFEGSPRTYIVLPGDRVKITHEVPDWTDLQFYIESKEEPEDTKAGYPMIGRIAGPWYSDTDHNPLPSPLPPARLNPFAAPPVVVDVDLTEEAVDLTNGAPFTVIRGGVTFGAFVGQQRGRVWVKGPSDAEYKETGITITPDSGTLAAGFELKAVEVGLYAVKVVSESDPFGISSAVLADQPEFTLNVTGDLIRALAPTDGIVLIDGFGDFLSTAIGHPRASEKPETYEVQVWDNEDFGVDPETHLKGILPVTPGTNHACLLNSGLIVTGSGIGTAPDEEAGGGGVYDVFTVAHATRNNLYSLPWDGVAGEFGNPITGVTLEALSKTYQFFDFSLQFYGANNQGSSFAAAVGLQTRLDADPVAGSFAPDESLCPLYVEASPGTTAGTIKLTFKSFGATVAELDNVDPGFSEGFGTGSDPETSPRSRRGPRIRFELAGAEYRVKIDPESGGRPLVVISADSDGHAFPLRLAMACTGVFKTHASAVVRIQAGGDFLTTTYSVANQIKFQGSQQSRVFLRWVQKSKYSQISDGLPLDIIAPPL